MAKVFTKNKNTATDTAMDDLIQTVKKVAKNQKAQSDSNSDASLQSDKKLTSVINSQRRLTTTINKIQDAVEKQGSPNQTIQDNSDQLLKVQSAQLKKMSEILQITKDGFSSIIKNFDKFSTATAQPAEKSFKSKSKNQMIQAIEEGHAKAGREPLSAEDMEDMGAAGGKVPAFLQDTSTKKTDLAQQTAGVHPEVFEALNNSMMDLKVSSANIQEISEKQLSILSSIAESQIFKPNFDKPIVDSINQASKFIVKQFVKNRRVDTKKDDAIDGKLQKSFDSLQKKINASMKVVITQSKKQGKAQQRPYYSETGPDGVQPKAGGKQANQMDTLLGKIEDLLHPKKKDERLLRLIMSFADKNGIKIKDKEGKTVSWQTKEKLGREQDTLQRRIGISEKIRGQFETINPMTYVRKAKNLYGDVKLGAEVLKNETKGLFTLSEHGGDIAKELRSKNKGNKYKTAEEKEAEFNKKNMSPEQKQMETMLNGIVDELRNGKTHDTEFYQHILDSLEKITGYSQKMKQDDADAAKAAEEMHKEDLQEGEKTRTTLVASIKSMMGKVWEGTKTAAGKVGNFIKSPVKSIKSLFSAGVQKVKSFFGAKTDSQTASSSDTTSSKDTTQPNDPTTLLKSIDITLKKLLGVESEETKLQKQGLHDSESKNYSDLMEKTEAGIEGKYGSTGIKQVGEGQGGISKTAGKGGGLGGMMKTIGNVVKGLEGMSQALPVVMEALVQLGPALLVAGTAVAAFTVGMIIGTKIAEGMEKLSNEQMKHEGMTKDDLKGSKEDVEEKLNKKEHTAGQDFKESLSTAGGLGNLMNGDFEGAARNYGSYMTGGLIDSATTHERKKSNEQTQISAGGKNEVTAILANKGFTEDQQSTFISNHKEEAKKQAGGNGTQDPRFWESMVEMQKKQTVPEKNKEDTATEVPPVKTQAAEMPTTTEVPNSSEPMGKDVQAQSVQQASEQAARTQAAEDATIDSGKGTPSAPIIVRPPVVNVAQTNVSSPFGNVRNEFVRPYQSQYRGGFLNA